VGFCVKVRSKSRRTHRPVELTNFNPAFTDTWRGTPAKPLLTLRKSLRRMKKAPAELAGASFGGDS
jgi:hypothetical protein